MCGRYTLRTPLQRLLEIFDLVEAPVELPPRYNIAPTQDVAAIRSDGEGRRRLDLLRWGLIPSWAKDPGIGSRMINARSETVAAKPSFRGAFRRRRCLVLADAFYEWKREGRAKQPYWIGMDDVRPFAFAGLWERWTGAGEPIESCTIITTDANERLCELHDRMPVILEPDDYDLWLDPNVAESNAVESLLRPYDSGAMKTYAVDTIVNNTRNDDPRCVQPLS